MKLQTIYIIFSRVRRLCSGKLHQLTGLFSVWYRNMEPRVTDAFSIVGGMHRRSAENKRRRVPSAGRARVRSKARLNILLALIASATMTAAFTDAESPLLLQRASTGAAVPELGAVARLKDSSPKSLGVFRISFYTRYDEGCNSITANGEQVRPGICSAPPEIPLGTFLIVNGKQYEVTDRGGAIKGKRLDIYVETREEAFARGIQYWEVYAVP
jgi:3D (Asp-Asp-Asp) domain-containing protein